MLMVMFEIGSGKRPYHDVDDRFGLMRGIVDGVRPSGADFVPGEPPEAIEGFQRLMAECWNGEAAVRPGAVAVARQLDALLGMHWPEARADTDSDYEEIDEALVTAWSDAPPGPGPPLPPPRPESPPDDEPYDDLTSLRIAGSHADREADYDIPD